jgi:hypothetical protein
MPGNNEPSGFIMTTILGHRRRVRRELPRAGARLVHTGRRRGTHRRGGRRHRRALRVEPHRKAARIAVDCATTRAARDCSDSRGFAAAAPGSILTG